MRTVIEEFKHRLGPNGEDFTLDDLVYFSHECAKEKGWHDPGKDRTVGEYLMLMVSELAEALEEYRAGHDVGEIYYGEGGKPEGVPIELADCLIRIFDFCGKHDIDLLIALLTKMKYNFTREHRHGNKVI